MLKIGVIGAGHLGKMHLNHIKEIPEYTLIGFYDRDTAVAQSVSTELKVRAYPSMEELIKDADAIDVVVPAAHHYEYVTAALKQSKHVFIENPLACTVAEAKNLVALAHEANVKTQLGYAERFNPAFLAVKDKCSHPMFIEGHRLAQFNPHGTDISVVFDLMIHDIDIVLSLVKSEVKRISATGVAIVGDTPDIANARIEFDNGCVANLTASRVSLKNMHKLRFFQKDAYISVNMLKHKTELVRVKDVAGNDNQVNMFSLDVDKNNTKRKKEMYLEQPEVILNNAIRMELLTFADAIINNQPAKVTIEDGAKALDIAYKILEKINFLQTA